MVRSKSRQRQLMYPRQLRLCIRNIELSQAQAIGCRRPARQHISRPHGGDVPRHDLKSGLLKGIDIMRRVLRLHQERRPAIALNHQPVLRPRRSIHRTKHRLEALGLQLRDSFTDQRGTRRSRLARKPPQCRRARAIQRRCIAKDRQLRARALENLRRAHGGGHIGMVTSPTIMLNAPSIIHGLS